MRKNVSSFPFSLLSDLLLLEKLTLVQYYVSTKLEVSTAFLFLEHRMRGTDRRTDGRTSDGRGATLNEAPIGRAA